MIGRHVASKARLNTIIALVLSPTATLSALIWAPAHVPGTMLNLRCESPPALGPASTTRGTLYLFRLRPTGSVPHPWLAIRMLNLEPLPKHIQQRCMGA